MGSALTGPRRPNPGAGDWMQVLIQVPPKTAHLILDYLTREHGFKAVDWCVMERDVDLGRVDYDPCPPLTRRYHD